jgi:hypothetical protein
VFDDVRVIEFQPTVADADFELAIDDVTLVLDPSLPSPFAEEEAPVRVEPPPSSGSTTSSSSSIQGNRSHSESRGDSGGSRLPPRAATLVR